MVNSILQVLAVILLCDITLSHLLLPQALTILEDVQNTDIPEDANLNFTELAKKYGHPAREYQVITEDGYILTMHRIPGKRGPVLLQHGFLDSSDTYIIRGNKSMAITLAEEGYDLWFGNTRGNKYSRQHVSLNPDLDKQQFWNFSVQELGCYDLPTMIDFVLENTNTTKLSAIGHSEGTTMFFVLGASRPEYNEKIDVFIALGPAAYLTHMKPPLKIAVDFSPEIDVALKTLGIEEILNNKSALKQLLLLLCSTIPLGNEICAEGLSFVGGDDPDEIEKEFTDVFASHYFAGTSRKNFVHLAQISREKRFQKYDFGLEKNLEIYGCEIPPEYDLKKVTMMVELFVGEKDKLSTAEDANVLKNILPNNRYTLINYSHFDFVWGRNMDQDLFPLVKQVLKEYCG